MKYERYGIVEVIDFFDDCGCRVRVVGGTRSIPYWSIPPIWKKHSVW